MEHTVWVLEHLFENALSDRKWKYPVSLTIFQPSVDEIQNTISNIPNTLGMVDSLSMFVNTNTWVIKCNVSMLLTPRSIANKDIPLTAAPSKPPRESRTSLVDITLSTDASHSACDARQKA